MIQPIPAICDQAFLDTIRCAAYPFGVRRSSADESADAIRKACSNLIGARNVQPETKAAAVQLLGWMDQAERETEGNQREIISAVFAGAK